MDQRSTAPTPELERESPQEKLDREQRPESEDPESAAQGEILEALVEAGAMRSEDLLQRIGFSGDREAWKRTLRRLHNEGYVKVRWVGLADPDPVEVRFTERGRAWLAGRAGAGNERRETARGPGTPSAVAPRAGEATPGGKAAPGGGA